MPRDLKLRKTGDTEGLRAFWREKSKRKYWRNIEHERARMRAKAERKAARHRALGLRPDGKPYVGRYGPTKTPPRHTICPWCGTEFIQDGKPSEDRIGCSPNCGIQYAHHLARLRRWLGQSCPISIVNCAQCGDPITVHGRTRRRLCSAACRREEAKEWQRRTRYTAIRYWAVDNSPEALAVAADYFRLRQAIREVNKRHG